MTINDGGGGGEIVQTSPGVCVCMCGTNRSLSRGHLQVCQGRGGYINKSLSRLWRGGGGGGCGVLTSY